MGAKSSQIPVLLMTEDQKRLLNKPEIVDEGVDYHLSKPFFDPKSKTWMQRKIKAAHSEKKDTYKKELKKVSESYSFRKFVTEYSEINPESQYTPNADVKTNKSGLDALDSGKPKKTSPKDINKAFALFLQSDPISS